MLHKKTWLGILTAVLMMLSVANQAWAATYYVSPSGNDSANGSSGAPFRTINKGVSVLNAGDTLMVAAGTYEPFVVSKSGSSSSPLNIQGNQAKISGGTNSIKLTGNYINVSGFETYGSNSHSVRISGKNIKYSNFIVRNSVHENKVSGEERCIGSRAGESTGGWGSGLKVEVGAENITIENGSIFHNCGEGLAITRGINASIKNVTAYDNFSVNFYLDNSKNVTLSDSFAYCTNDDRYYRRGGPASGISIGEEVYSGWGAQLENITVTNNVVFGCSSVRFYGSDVSNGGLKGALIANNTIWGIRDTSMGVYIANSPNNRDIVIRNNVHQGSISTGSGISATNNQNSATFATTPGYSSIASFQLAAGSTGYGVNGYQHNSNNSSSTPTPTPTPVRATSPTPTPTPTPTSNTNSQKAGDLNKDGKVDLTDYNLVVSKFGNPYTIYDYNQVVGNYGK